MGTEPGRVAAIASALRGIGEASLARPAIDAALAEHPKHYGLLLNRGLIEVDHGNYREAAGYFDQARKLAPREASTHYLYGVCLERSGKARKAISVLKKATVLSPKTLVYRLALGRAFRAADRLDSAISVYRKAIKEFPDNAHVQQVYARALFDDKKYKQASKEYERLITMQPDEPAPRFLLAIAYGQYLGKPKEAYRLLKEYEELGGEEPGALRWLKQLEHRYGKKK